MTSRHLPRQCEFVIYETDGSKSSSVLGVTELNALWKLGAGAVIQALVTLPTHPTQALPAMSDFGELVWDDADTEVDGNDMAIVAAGVVAMIKDLVNSLR